MTCHFCNVNVTHQNVKTHRFSILAPTVLAFEVPKPGGLRRTQTSYLNAPAMQFGMHLQLLEIYGNASTVYVYVFVCIKEKKKANLTLVIIYIIIIVIIVYYYYL